mmetsp:Transcript_20650/g.30364  ORF Transcript_20650/g.30364 Transcript_20650/m.30364 type:complete len:285 (+) Transcript_20650:99-953(+)|eukprot:CAMPEP_0195518120 /NCGR_PEP_ID=MMETSP0794_2-20130614/12294_1 /TAXON_ID=515487 /ORGANISM="Stephanopyxis turris, Strain CCMP 815" /LENGTH=284 /DNA_ID=CAMNT_0040647037 /DNA_START=96 /DNA_END=950 /DNA_ORIENTATION=+
MRLPHNLLLLLLGFTFQDAPTNVSCLLLSSKQLVTKSVFTKIRSHQRSTPRLCSTIYLQSLKVSDEKCPDVTNIDTKSDTLSSLLGNAKARDSFFANDFGKNPFFRRRDCNGSDLPPPITGIDIKSLYETNEYISLRIRGSQDFLDKSAMSYADFTAYVDNGSSAVVPIIETDYMYPFMQQMEQVLGQSLSMNIYHSGPGAVALNKHFDAYDVFVLQLAGEKEWIIQADGEWGKLKSINAWTNITMSVGDVMYLPQGIFHAATGGQKGSTHVTIGLEKIQNNAN